jgi:hypothetical protein
MRALVTALFLSVAVLFPTIGNAQVYQFRAPAPEVTAAGAVWQVNSVPIVVDGLVYYPTGGFRMFDGQVMAHVGLFEGVPIYADATIEPGSVVYVPVGRDRMREYERRRNGELAGTTGSRVPTFPVASASAESLRSERVGAIGTTGAIEPSPPLGGADAAATLEPAFASYSAGTSGSAGTGGVASPAVANVSDRAMPRRTWIESIPPPEAGNGVWLEFDGARWYSAGEAVSFTTDRFEPVGMYRGFPVYREKNGNANRIWVAAVQDGPLAPYVRQ